MTVEELKGRMSSLEFTQWLAVNAIAPIGQRRDDIRTGILASLTANINRKKGARAYTPVDFMPFEPKAPEPEVLPSTALLTMFRSMKNYRKASAA